MRVNRRGGLQVHCLTRFRVLQAGTAVHNLIFDIFRISSCFFVIFPYAIAEYLRKIPADILLMTAVLLANAAFKIISCSFQKLQTNIRQFFVRKYVRFCIDKRMFVYYNAVIESNRCSQQCREVMIMNENEGRKVTEEQEQKSKTL